MGLVDLGEIGTWNLLGFVLQVLGSLNLKFEGKTSWFEGSWKFEIVGVLEDLQIFIGKKTLQKGI